MWYNIKDCDLKAIFSSKSNKYEESDNKGRLLFINSFRNLIDKFEPASSAERYDLAFEKDSKITYIEIKLRNFDLKWLLRNKPLVDYSKFEFLSKLSAETNSDSYLAIYTSDNFWLLLKVNDRLADSYSIERKYTKVSSVFNLGYELSTVVLFNVDFSIDKIFDSKGRAIYVN